MKVIATRQDAMIFKIKARIEIVDIIGFKFKQTAMITLDLEAWSEQV